MRRKGSLMLWLDGFHLNILPSQKEPVKPVRHKHGLFTELPLQVPPFLQGSGLQSKFAPSNTKALRHKNIHTHISPFYNNLVQLSN